MWSKILIYGNIEFHNCFDLLPSSTGSGLLIQRIPENVRGALNPRAKERVRNPDQVELRFETTSDRIAVTLSNEGDPAWMLPFWGDLPALEAIPIEGEPKRIEISKPERFMHHPEGRLGSERFDSSVWRLQFTGRHSNLYFHSMEGDDLKPPAPEHCPNQLMLAYGTSITHGNAATLSHLSYAYQTARALGIDLINIGMGGSCYCENEVADFIAAMDWDIGVFALSVNMIGGGFTIDEFKNRTRYLFDRAAGNHPNRKVFCITIYPHFRDLSPSAAMENDQASFEEFREALREVAQVYGGDNLVLLEGPDILDDPAGLTADLVHPSDLGMTMMARNLTRKIEASLA